MNMMNMICLSVRLWCDEWEDWDEKFMFSFSLYFLSVGMPMFYYYSAAAYVYIS